MLNLCKCATVKASVCIKSPGNKRATYRQSGPEPFITEKQIKINTKNWPSEL